MFSRVFHSAESLSPTKFFVITAAVFGLLFILITPPFQGADEIVHFYRAYQVSEGRFVSDHNAKAAGGTLPKSLGKVVALTNTPTIAFYPQNKYDIYKTEHTLAVKTDPNVKEFYDFRASTTYSPVPYIGASSGILVSRILHLPALLSLYAGRLGDLIVWILLMGYAIASIPRRKWALVAIGLLPMAIFQAATLNGDAVTIGSLALLLALILKYRDEKEALSHRQLALLLVTATAMVLSKLVMFVFLPIFVLLGKHKFKTPRLSYAWKAGLILIPFVCFLGWMFIIRDINSTTAYMHKENPGMQLRFILHNPNSYINVLWNTYFYSWGDGITRSFIGTFGWSDAPLSELITTVGYIGLTALLIANYDTAKKRTWFDKKAKTLLWILLVVYWLAVSTSLYLYYSPLHFKIVYGLQGRYFLPIGILTIPLLISNSIKITRQAYAQIAIRLSLFLLTASIITLYVRYFVNNV